MPEHIRAEPDIRILWKLLKTHLFNLAFHVHWAFWFLVCDSWNAPPCMFSMCNRRITDAPDDDDDDDKSNALTTTPPRATHTKK